MTERKLLRYVDGNRVAILALTHAQHNGIAQVVREQAAMLTDDGREVTVLSFEAGNTETEYDVQTLYSPSNATLDRVYRILWPVVLVPFLSLIYTLRRFDTVISHKYPFNTACALATALFDIHYIYYDHGISPPEMYDGVVARWYSRTMRRLQAVTARPASVVIAISQFCADELQSEGGPEATEIIYNTVPRTVIEHDPTARDIRDHHDIPLEAPVVLFVGRITKHKNVHCLLEAHNRLCERSAQSPYLVLVGKPTQQRYFEEVSGMSNDTVRFAGYVDSEYLASYYKQADIYATASLWEGCNLTVLEAQQMGLPVVAFDAGAHPETVQTPPGILVPKGACKKLADGIDDTLESLRVGPSSSEA